jgi:hypothetical protein
MSEISRRSALTAGAAALATGAVNLTAAAAVKGTSDPVFAAIEEHRMAFALHERACIAQGDFNDLDETARDSHLEAQLNTIVDESFQLHETTSINLLKIVPSSLAGAVALLNHVSDCHFEDCGSLFEQFWPHVESADGEEMPFHMALQRHVADAIETMIEPAFEVKS